MPDNTNLFISLFIIGLLGSTHCLAMCSGLQQLFINMAPNKKRSILMFYHAGRLTSYAIITTLIATVLNRFATQTAGLVPYAVAIRLVAAVIILWIGINYFIKIPLPRHLSIASNQLWQIIQRFAQPFLPPKNTWQVYAIGLVWGWLPCSLVYSALTIALASDNVLNSIFAMLCFGLGTTPALLGIGCLSRHLQQTPQMKQLLAGLLILIGVYALVSL